ncbi:ABC transporter substrate-binding protein [Bradyrhizobium sp. CCGB12]|uniref:ABC transporter substrate-binding protein n=1 Tax=Bradyrhizobium sp. CCGB12 TaxID=2949632 RepID=UPI0020B3D7FA|nr:ABC transporter substrate-binding protein [Bradyrhizobium sp. CCGB12]MCP3387827.1 ABC transporter substrate-binding protein [Bradyrhizobium sp. CCGB12]
MLRSFSWLAVAITQFVALPALAQISDDMVRIGVLNDQSGQFAEMAGKGSIIAARLAAADFGGTVHGKPIEIIAADHQNKPDIGATIARRWFDTEKVDAIVDVPGSAIALAVQELARTKNRTLLLSGAASSDLTGKACSPLSSQWSDDSYAMSAGLANAIARDGGDSWFFITADYAFGHTLEKDASEAIAKNNGKVLGSVRHPFATADFASFLLQAQNSKAKVVALANTAGDTINALKQASEFGLMQGGQKVVAMVLFVTDVHSIGLPLAQGTYLMTSFYWDQNDASRKFAKRFFEANGTMPTKEHAATYASVLHYLKAIDSVGTDEAGAVNKRMRELPVDYFGHAGHIQPNGRAVYEVMLYRVKSPQDSKYPWDYFKPVQAVPNELIYRSPDAAGCTTAR